VKLKVSLTDVAKHKYVPLRQRAGTQKVKQRKLLVQHVIDKNTCESCQSLSLDIVRHFYIVEDMYYTTYGTCVVEGCM
jgi:hypothetical protein